MEGKKKDKKKKEKESSNNLEEVLAEGGEEKKEKKKKKKDKEGGDASPEVNPIPEEEVPEGGEEKKKKKKKNKDKEGGDVSPDENPNPEEAVAEGGDEKKEKKKKKKDKDKGGEEGEQNPEVVPAEGGDEKKEKKKKKDKDKDKDKASEDKVSNETPVEGGEDKKEKKKKKKDKDKGGEEEPVPEPPAEGGGVDKKEKKKKKDKDKDKEALLQEPEANLEDEAKDKKKKKKDKKEDNEKQEPIDDKGSKKSRSKSKDDNKSKGSKDKDIESQLIEERESKIDRTDNPRSNEKYANNINIGYSPHNLENEKENYLGNDRDSSNENYKNVNNIINMRDRSFEHPSGLPLIMNSRQRNLNNNSFAEKKRLTQENQKYYNNLNYYSTNFNKNNDFGPPDSNDITKCCYCGKREDEFAIKFTCGHFTCLKCIVKNLLISQFKSLENKNKASFICRCRNGTADIEFDDLIKLTKNINKPKPNGKCRKHKEIGVKYCTSCFQWLCSNCLSIHNEFNSYHILSDKESRHKLCEIHGQACTFYCKNCKLEVCPNCVIRNERHFGHNYVDNSDFEGYAIEIKNKLQYKSYNELSQCLDDYSEKINYETAKKLKKTNEVFDDLIKNLEYTKNNYNAIIRDKKNEVKKVIEIIRNCFYNFYDDLNARDQDSQSIEYLGKVGEITRIEPYFSNYEELVKTNDMLKKFLDKDYFSYAINSVNNNYNRSFKAASPNRIRMSSYGSNDHLMGRSHPNMNLSSGPIRSNVKGSMTPYYANEQYYNNNSNNINRSNSNSNNKYTENQKLRESKSANFFNKSPEVKYHSEIKYLNDTVFTIIKLSLENSFAAAVGKEILIYPDIENNPSESFSLIGHSKNVLCLAELSENKLASGSEDRTIKIWSISEQRCRCSITGRFEKIDSMLALSSNQLAIGSYNMIRIYDTDTRSEIYNLVGHEKSVSCIIRLSSSMIVSSSYDQTIKVWDLNSRNCAFTLFGHDQTVFVVLLLRDGRLASGSGSWDKSIKIWNLKHKVCEGTLLGHRREVKTMKQLMNGWLLSGSVDKTIKVWDIRKKVCLQTLICHNDVVLSLCIINSSKFVSGGRDKQIIIWKYD